MASSSGSSFIRKASVLIAGGGVYGSAVYMAYHYNNRNQALAATTMHSNTTNDASTVAIDKPPNYYRACPTRNQQYEQIAELYDDSIGRDEFFLGINLLRRCLLYFYATGTVLEVGAGTARNLPYYVNSSTVDRVVLMDQSDNMLQQARQKILDLNDTDQQARFCCVTGDAVTTNLPANSFDTVVDTFGLCSYNDPVAALEEMARVCKPNGKILLLEHGRSSTFDLLSQHLDDNAEQHARNWGCVWNRDLDVVLQDSSQFLTVERCQKWHFGTTYYVVCVPNKKEE